MASEEVKQTGVTARTRWSFGLGCIGRDATYTLVSNFILTYLTLAVGLTNWQLGAVGVVIVAARIWDAVNDPMMGTIIDNTRTRFGKFKPYIITGAVLNSVFTVLLFSGAYPNSEQLMIVIFAITYILWGMTYTMNDISYWSMLPSLTLDPKEREKVTSTARIGANLGLFLVTALVPMLTSVGKLVETYRGIAIVVAAVFVLCQILVIWGVRQQHNAITDADSHTTLRGMLRTIRRNDQLLAIIIAILLFNIGYYTTTAFGIQFFYFDYGNYGGMEFTLFALTIGVAQILTLALYPRFAKNLSRRQLFGVAIGMVVIGYLGFMAVGYVLPMHMVPICVIGFILFSGQAIIQLLNYVLLADTVEYGQWKLGTRNESVVFSLNPFITKLASAVQAGIFAFTLAFTGLNRYSEELSVLENSALTKEEINRLGNELVATIPAESTLWMRISMLVVPLLLILASYAVYLKKFKISEEMYAGILKDLEERAKGEINNNGNT